MASKPREKELTAAQKKELVGLLETKRDELRAALRARRSGAATSRQP